LTDKLAPHLTIRTSEDAGAVEGILEFMLDKR
jgi:hypothetical protein